MFQVNRIFCLADAAFPGAPVFAHASRVARVCDATICTVPSASPTWFDDVTSGDADLLVVGSVADDATRRLVEAVDLPVLITGQVGIRRLLAPTDLSDASRQSLRVAADLATAYDVPLGILHVVERPQYVALNATDLLSLSDATLQERTARRQLRAFVASVLGPDADAELFVEHGDAADRIHRFTHDADDLVVLSSHGSVSQRTHTFGNVTSKLLRRLTGPVLVTRTFGASLFPPESGDGVPDGSTPGISHTNGLQ